MLCFIFDCCPDHIVSFLPALTVSCWLCSLYYALIFIALLNTSACYHGLLQAFPFLSLIPSHPLRIASCPDGTQAASLDIVKAYHNSPISPAHKPYILLCGMVRSGLSTVLFFGLAPSGGIQGSVADALIDILKYHGIDVTMKWVDDLIFFHSPSNTPGILCNGSPSVYSFDLNTIVAITTSLSIPWHPPSAKGSDINFLFLFVGFSWHCTQHTISLPEDKPLKALTKVNTFLQLSTHCVTCCDCVSILSTLQHICFIYRNSDHSLTSFCSFMSKFPKNWALHHVPTSVKDSLAWWHCVLSIPNAVQSLSPQTVIDLDIYVDASTSWGIGLMVGDHWAAWSLCEGWKVAGQDIG